MYVWTHISKLEICYCNFYVSCKHSYSKWIVRCTWYNKLYTQIGGRVVTNHLFIYLYGKGMPLKLKKKQVIYWSNRYACIYRNYIFYISGKRRNLNRRIMPSPSSIFTYNTSINLYKYYLINRIFVHEFFNIKVVLVHLGNVSEFMRPPRNMQQK